jgi:colanic acid/amylovoran biosynthesis glycosyltransferase
MMIPPTVRMVDGTLEVENDYANNLCAYLANFDHVTFACPLLPDGAQGILKSQPIGCLRDADRLTYIRLPHTYREDKHLRHYFSTRQILLSEINKAKYLLFSPHANYDWPTVGVKLAMKLKRKYGIESDYDNPSVSNLQLRVMPFGAKKLRKSLWARSFNKDVNRFMACSTIALLQGQEVYDAYKQIAPNPKKVLNVQVSSDDRISPAELKAKLNRLTGGEPLSIIYAGRMVEMKGPLDWLRAINAAVKKGVDLRAVWFGDGPSMAEMQSNVERLNLSRYVSLPGVLDREELTTRLRRADIFLFCHKTGESPRCLSEALATGCPLVGYSGAFPRDLVATHGGGEFVDRDDWEALASMLISLDRDRARLAQLVEAAAASGMELDRDTAIKNRIDLIQKHLG